jgi:carbamoyl-phosphate synthase large subunit
MKKILITSVGSLVGQNILDSIEERRKDLKIIGLNSIAESQRIYRCDRAYLVPQTASPDFTVAFQDIIEKEQPDIILPGRDYDIVFLANYKKKNSYKNALIPVGEPHLAEMMLDKYQTHLFAEKYGLPYAATILYRNSSDEASLKAFVQEYGFPLLVKPREGFASMNVIIITNNHQLDNLLKDGGEILFQEYLSPVEGLEKFQKQLLKGIPLTFQIPICDHMVSQVVISKNGNLLDYISTKQNLVMGRTEYARVYDDPDLNNMVENYANTLAEQGWWGFLNIQSRRDRNQKWKVFELNPRMSGATSARLLLGLDELGLLLNEEKPEWHFPVEKDNTKRCNHVFKYVSDFSVADSDIEQFRVNGFWQKG